MSHFSNLRRSPVPVLLMLPVAFLLFGSAGASAPPVNAAQDYVRAALKILRLHSVKGEEPDWKKVEQDALAAAQNATTPAETYPALLGAMRQIGDQQGAVSPRSEPFFLRRNLGMTVFFPERIVAFVTPNSAAAKAGIRSGDAIETFNGKPLEPGEDLRFAALPVLGEWTQEKTRIGASPRYRPRPLEVVWTHLGAKKPIQAKLEAGIAEFNAAPEARVFERVGYLEITRQLNSAVIPLKNGKPVKGAKPVPYVQFIHDKLRDMEAKGVTGWILDLRRCDGGDPYSMIAAAGPLLGEGQIAAFVYADKKTPIRYEKGKCYDFGRLMASANAPYTLKRPAAPIAILTSRATAGSGELLAIALKRRANVRYFGEATYGTPSLLEPFVLPDHALLYCTTAYDADRNGQEYHETLTPDEAVKTDWAHFAGDSDPAVKIARAWIQAHLSSGYPAPRR